MLISPSTKDYSVSTRPLSSPAQSLRVRIRNLHICEPSFPSRDTVRRENYARRKAQESQGWACLRTIPYQDIDYVHLPPQPPKPILKDSVPNLLPIKPILRKSASTHVSSRPKTSPPVQDEQLTRLQFETNIRRLQTAHQKHMKKTSHILKSVQLGRSAKDVVENYIERSVSCLETTDTKRSLNIIGDDKEQSVLYDKLRDDFDDEDDMEVSSSVSGIRDDIMSPRTITNMNIMNIRNTETSELHKQQSIEMPIAPMKGSQSAPPMNRDKKRQDGLRPFTPNYSGLSERLRLQEKMPHRDALYRQLCCILWLLRALNRAGWDQPIGGCWNISQWLKPEISLPTNPHNQSIKKPPESNKAPHKKSTSAERKSVSKTKSHREHSHPPIPTATTPTVILKKQHSTDETSVVRLPEASFDSQTGSNILSDVSERLDLPVHSVNIGSDLNESTSSKSNQEDTTDNTNIDSSQQTTNIPYNTTISIGLTTNTSRTSVSSNISQFMSHSASAQLASIREKQRSPDILLKKWTKRQTLTTNDPKEPPPLAEKELRLLHVGDKGDLNRIFGLENTNKEQQKLRETRETERKLVTNIKRRPTTSLGFTKSKEHAHTLYRIKRDFNEFTEEQSTILNNKLEQADNSRLFYYQQKLNCIQKNMSSSPIIDLLLKKLRFDNTKKKENAIYLKYQAWYVDLSRMIEKQYKDDYIISLLLEEIKEFADPSEKPTDIQFRKIVVKFKPHEICHPDIMAAIEFIRIRVIRMDYNEFDVLFCKYFPTVTKYVMTVADVNGDEENQSKT